MMVTTTSWMTAARRDRMVETERKIGQLKKTLEDMEEREQAQLEEIKVAETIASMSDNPHLNVHGKDSSEVDGVAEDDSSEVEEVAMDDGYDGDTEPGHTREAKRAKRRSICEGNPFAFTSYKKFKRSFWTIEVEDGEGSKPVFITPLEDLDYEIMEID